VLRGLSTLSALASELLARLPTMTEAFELGRLMVRTRWRS